MKKLTFAILMSLAPMSFAAQDGHLPAKGDPEAGKAKSVACAACHGQDGNKSLQPEYPKLGGQHAGYLAVQLQQFKSGVRANAIMAGQTMALSEQDMLDLAAFFATQPHTLHGTPEGAIEPGQVIYRAGIAEKGVPACIACHGPTGSGNPLADYPVINGQHPAYTIKQLQDYKSGARIGGDEPTTNQRIMQDIAKKLTEAEMQALADYVAGLH